MVVMAQVRCYITPVGASVLSRLEETSFFGNAVFLGFEVCVTSFIQQYSSPRSQEKEARFLLKFERWLKLLKVNL